MTSITDRDSDGDHIWRFTEIDDVVDSLSATWILTERDDAIKSEVDRLLKSAFSRFADRRLKQSTRANETRCLALTGESGAGKSSLLERIFAKHPALINFGVEGEPCPLISVSAPAPSTLGGLGREVLHALGYPIARSSDRNLIWEYVRRHLKELRIVALHIDEFQNVTETANKPEITQILGTLKTLMNSREWPVALILSGLPSANDVLRMDTQVRRRCRFRRLQRLSPDDIDMVEGLIAGFADKASLSVAPQDDLAARLIHAANDQLGVTIELVIEAVRSAQEAAAHAPSASRAGGGGRRIKAAAPTLDIHNFADAYAARNGCEAEHNPFVVENWGDVDTTIVFEPAPELPGDDAPVRRPRRQRKG